MELNEKIEMLEAENTELRKDKGRLRSQWQEIDYSQVAAGNAPFDGERCFVKATESDGVKVVHFMKWHARWGRFVAGREGAYPHRAATHWMPVPKFLKG